MGCEKQGVWLGSGESVEVDLVQGGVDCSDDFVAADVQCEGLLEVPVGVEVCVLGGGVEDVEAECCREALQDCVVQPGAGGAGVGAFGGQRGDAVAVERGEGAEQALPGGSGPELLAGGGVSGAEGVRLLVGGGGHGVVAAVNVEDFAGDGAGEVGEQEASGVGDRGSVVGVPGERGLAVPGVRQAGEAGDACRGAGVQWAGGDEVGADALGSEVAGQVAVDRFECGFADPHPVVDRPGRGGVEVEPDQRAAGRRGELADDAGQGGVGVGAGVEGGADLLVGRGEEVSAQGVAGGEADRVQRPVDVGPVVADVVGEVSQIGWAGEVDVQDRSGPGQGLGGVCGQVVVAWEGGEQDVGAGALGVFGDGVGNAVGADDPGDDEPLVGEQVGDDGVASTLGAERV